MSITPDQTYKQWATEKQWEAYVAHCEHGSNAKAAKALGVTKTAIQERIFYMKKKAARQGYAPEHGINQPLPAGLTLKGTSQLHDGVGNLKEGWTKSKTEGMDPEEAYQLPDPKRTIKLATYTDQEGRVIGQWKSEKPEDVAREQAWEAFAKQIAERMPAIRPTPAPRFSEVASDRILNMFPVGDHHYGLLCWGMENGGNNYDLQIADKLLHRAFDYLMNAAPPSKTCVIPFMGDFKHSDSLLNETARGTRVDTDSRPSRTLEVCMDAMIVACLKALKVYETVYVVVSRGNHDPYTMEMMRIALDRVFRNEPRVVVDTTPGHYHYHRFGENLLMFTHGDKGKIDQYPSIMAHDRKEDWGRTTYRYCWIGHFHHSQRFAKKGHTGAEVESLQVLPPQDAWHSEEGYRSQRSMLSVTYHEEFGEMGRNRVTPEMIEAFYGPVDD